MATKVSRRVYRYHWKNNPVRAEWRGRLVRIIHVYKSGGSVLIESLDGARRMVTSRRALRRVPHADSNSRNMLQEGR
jgi:hypothetical protein